MNYKKIFNVTYDDRGRRHWNVEKSVRVEEEKKYVPPPVDFSKGLETRMESPEIEKFIGKRKRVKEGEEAGFSCKICDFACKDSLSWLDHLNSRLHNRMEGKQMKVEKITEATIEDKLKSLKSKKKKRKLNSNEAA